MTADTLAAALEYAARGWRTGRFQGVLTKTSGLVWSAPAQVKARAQLALPRA